MKEHPLWAHISQLSHWTALWSFRTAPLHNPQSALQFVQYQDPFPDSNFNRSLSPQVWQMMRESVFHSSRIWRPYPMPCNMFCKGGIETWDLCSDFDVPNQDEKSDTISFRLRVWSYVALRTSAFVHMRQTRQHIKDWCAQSWNIAVLFGTPRV